MLGGGNTLEFSLEAVGLDNMLKHELQPREEALATAPMEGRKGSSIEGAEPSPRPLTQYMQVRVLHKGCSFTWEKVHIMREIAGFYRVFQHYRQQNLLAYCCGFS
jgi:hypothetical protein